MLVHVPRTAAAAGAPFHSHFWFGSFVFWVACCCSCSILPNRLLGFLHKRVYGVLVRNAILDAEGVRVWVPACMRGSTGRAILVSTVAGETGRREIDPGVPQGGVLSPALFRITLTERPRGRKACSRSSHCIGW